jgi:hypothetical protein
MKNMSDTQYWFTAIATLVALAIVIIGVFAALRFVENRYYSTVNKVRKTFAIYSVPLTLILIFGLEYYREQVGGICNAAGHNTVGWSCDLAWILMLGVLPISISLSAWYWAVYRNKLDPLDRASKL